MEKCGRGHSYKRKKGARRAFFRRPNDMRKCLQANKLKKNKQSQQTVASSTTTSTTAPLNSIKDGISLPEHWLAFPGEDSIQFSQMKIGLSGVLEPTLSVVLASNLTWSIHMLGKKVPANCNLLTSFPSKLISSDIVTNLLNCVHLAAVCPGNSDEQFVSLCEKRGGVYKKGHETIAYIDKTPIIGCDGQEYSCSVRRVECELICKRLGSHPRRCQACHSFRSTLRSALSRSSRENITTVSSHTNYIHLTPTEKNMRLKNLHQSLRSAKQHANRLEVKVQELIDKEGVFLESKDMDDISTIVNDVTPAVELNFPENSPQRVFWEQQKMYNRLRNKRQMRWHPLVMRFALNLKYMSSSAYRAVRQSSIISLPSERTLSDYTHWASPHNGLQIEFVEELHSQLAEALPVHQHQCALSMDEMKIKSCLVFNKHTGSLVGFVDLGNVNRDIEMAMSGGEQEYSPANLASEVFVLMARAVFKPSLCVPVSHYFSLSLKGEKIFPLVWESVEALELYNIPVVSLTSDGAKPNRRLYQLCQLKVKKAAIPYKTTNPYRSDAQLYFFCDTPHLLKTARNCFSNSFAHSKSRCLKKCGQEISWKWIESLYLSEMSTTTPGVRLCHKLTKDHVWLTSFTRMRVYLAAQVMSESVASALELLDNDKTKQTRVFIRMVDRFFDYLNVRSPKAHTFQRKDSIAPYRKENDERFKWLKKDFLEYLNDWETEASNYKGIKKKADKQKLCLSRETLQGMRITVMAFTELGPKLLNVPGVSYLLSEVFSQDPLERYFSRQRHRGGSNDNPTAYQVPFSAATLLQQQSIYKDLKTMNVEANDQHSNLQTVSTPLRKRPRQTHSDHAHSNMQV